MKRLAIVAVFLLTACATYDPRLALIDTCEGWATALDNMAVRINAGQMTLEQINTVDEWRPILNSLCQNPDGVDDPASAIKTIENALIEMQLGG